MQEYIDLLHVGKETKNLDYKRTYDWEIPKHKGKLVRTIISMANLRDGGYLILGVEELDNGSFSLMGMPEEHFQKLNTDHILSFVNNYAEPHVDIELHKFEYNEKLFIVIKVMEFSEIPIITKAATDGVKKGVIYARSSRMPETTCELSPTDLRDILAIATEKAMRRLQETVFRAGLKVAINDKDHSALFEEELGGL